RVPRVSPVGAGTASAMDAPNNVSTAGATIAPRSLMALAATWPPVCAAVEAAKNASTPPATTLKEQAVDAVAELHLVTRRVRPGGAHPSGDIAAGKECQDGDGDGPEDG